MLTTASVTVRTEPSDDPADACTVVVVDDHRCYAEMLSTALDNVPGLRCLGTASTADEGVALATRLRPDVVLMDIRMPDSDGLSATRRIRTALPDTQVAVVSAHREGDWVVRAAQAGASAFICKDGSLTEMVSLIRRAKLGRMVVSSSTSGPARTTAKASISTAVLTPRELEVLRCLALGMSVKAAARVLGITAHTCRGYVKAIYAELEVGSRLEMLVRARELGLLTTEAR